MSESAAPSSAPSSGPLPGPVRDLDSVELRHLRAFVAVAEELNFTRAAERLFMSGPTLSRHVGALERAVGCRLLHRSTHHVDLTPAGKELLDCAHNVTALLSAGLSATRAVGGELEARMSNLWEPIVEPTDENTDLTTYRAAVEDLHAQFPTAEDVEIQPLTAGGVPALRLTPPDPGHTLLLYLHGGGYIAGSAFGYRSTVTALVSGTDVTAVLPDYRLAPEHPFPAAVDDATAVYRWLLHRGHQPGDIVLAGDSAGAGLVMSTLLRLRDSGHPLPAGAVLLSPWVDLTASAFANTDAAEPAHVLTKAMLDRFATAYLSNPDHHPGADPGGLLTPLTTPLTGLPPLLLQTATGDPLLPDTQRLTDHAEASGVQARLELYPVTTHDFQLFWSFLPEAGTALSNAIAFVQHVARHSNEARVDRAPDRR